MFVREAPLGTAIENPIPGGSSMLRRYGRRVMGPFEQREAGWFGRLSRPPAILDGSSLLLFKNGELLGPGSVADTNRIMVGGSGGDPADIESATFQVVGGTLRVPQRPFQHMRGHMWAWEVSELESMADNMANPCRSPVYLLEDGRQLPMPHSIHDDIAQIGNGRFSHWGRYVQFASVSATGPNVDQNRFLLVIPSEPE